MSNLRGALERFHLRGLMSLSDNDLSLIVKAAERTDNLDDIWIVEVENESVCPYCKQAKVRITTPLNAIPASGTFHLVGITE